MYPRCRCQAGTHRVFDLYIMNQRLGTPGATKLPKMSILVNVFDCPWRLECHEARDQINLINFFDVNLPIAHMGKVKRTMRSTQTII